MRAIEISFYNQWKGLFTTGSNWNDFTLIRIEVERDNLLGMFTAYLSLLGLNWNWSVVYDEPKHDAFMVDVHEMIDNINKEIDSNG